MSAWRALVAWWKRGCRWLGAILLAWGAEPGLEAPPPEEPEIDPAIRRAVHRACAWTGVPVDRFGDDFDLETTGQLQSVLHWAARFLGIDHGLHTVGDLVVFLDFARKAQGG